MIATDMLIRSGNFFCQDCCADFDAPFDAFECPVCGGERISECPDDESEGETK